MADKYEIVGMADPAEARQEQFQKAYGVPVGNCYSSWEQILAQPKMADVAVIADIVMSQTGFGYEDIRVVDVQ